MKRMADGPIINMEHADDNMESTDRERIDQNQPRQVMVFEVNSPMFLARRSRSMIPLDSDKKALILRIVKRSPPWMQPPE